MLSNADARFGVWVTAALQHRQVHAALASGADAAFQEPERGRSALMIAAEAGHEQVPADISFSPASC